MKSTVPPVIASMAHDGALRCPRCHALLREVEPGVVCERCGTDYSTFNGVLDLFGLVGGTAGVVPGPAVALVEPVLAALDLPSDDASTVRDILARTALITSSNAEFDAEIRDLADRFGIEAPGVAVAAPRTDDQPAPEHLQLVVERHYIPK